MVVQTCALRIYLNRETFVDPDLLGGNADIHEVADDLRHYLRARHHAGGAGTVDLDTDNVGRIEERSPRVASVRCARKPAHALRDHLLNDGDADLFGRGIDGLL